MTHVRTFSLDATADPIHAAIARHRAAYDAFQVAPEGDAALIANDDYDAATDALVATPCATRFGALALLAHLRWWLAEEAEFSAGHQPGYGIAQARAADLTLFLGTNLPPTRPVRLPTAAPLGHLAAGIVRRLPPPGSALWLAPLGQLAAHAAEALAAVAIVVGGCILTGLATLL